MTSFLIQMSSYVCSQVLNQFKSSFPCCLWTWKQLQGFKGPFGDKEEKFSWIKRNPYVTEGSLQVSSLEIQEVKETKLVVQNHKCRFKKTLAVSLIHTLIYGQVSKDSLSWTLSSISLNAGNLTTKREENIT